MLLAVEGGGFFSSSASGYTNGLILLFLGRRNEERPVRVSSWNQYQLVEHDTHPDLQLPSKKNRASRRCTSFICFNCVPSDIDGPSPPKVDPVHQPETSPDVSSDGGNLTTSDLVYENERKVCSKSTLKKAIECSVIVKGDDARDSLEEKHGNVSCRTERRKVQWPDACGRELSEIREFEPSDECASDEEFEHGVVRRCECVVQ